MIFIIFLSLLLPQNHFMTFQFNIESKRTHSPKVWRKVLVPGNFSFHRFHYVIQTLFGWYDMHLNEFCPNRLGSFPVITHPDSLPEEEFKNSTRFKLGQYFDEGGNQITYTYDFGDLWEHKIKLEKIYPEISKRAVAVGRQGTCPPEDCGGTHGFKEFKKAINNPSHEEYASYSPWIGLEAGEARNDNQIHADTVVKILEKV